MIKGEMITGDFEENTITFEIDGKMTLQAGNYVILKQDEYDALVKNNVDLANVSNCDACDGTGLVEGEHFDDLQPCRNC